MTNLLLFASGTTFASAIAWLALGRPLTAALQQGIGLLCFALSRYHARLDAQEQRDIADLAEWWKNLVKADEGRRSRRQKRQQLPSTEDHRRHDP